MSNRQKHGPAFYILLSFAFWIGLILVLLGTVAK